ncbi:TetR family transcriptional regulator [Neobacillus bataviensis]|uniref:TetR family transcriptional regulator n=1 Tax=Neobacillus bataviensis TaxID=220685 RepID=A0A561DY62_9BACI|nr:TetR/AcrR family transcriptional regulator [Neobacillus bataviensis]TWE08313.1 TetR family transcriptional regulator [Neobacillus bataviensis]
MKHKLIETGIQLFDQNGFKSTSVLDIVQLLGVTKGTFYYYFNSKEELLKDIHLIYIEGLVQQQEKIIQNLKTTYTQKLNEIVQLLIRKYKNRAAECPYFSKRNAAVK